VRRLPVAGGEDEVDRHTAVHTVTLQCGHFRTSNKIRIVANFECLKHVFNIPNLEGYCTESLLLTRAKFGRLEETHGLQLQAKFHLNVFTVSATGSQNTQFWANFDIWGASVVCTDPLLPMRAKFSVLEHTHGVRLPAKFRLDRFIPLPSGGEKPQFLPFF